MGERLAKKVLLVGWDSADWNMITPLMDAGQMPALERLVNSGVMGNLATLWPILSPLLWTTIATGKRPYAHGITHFVEPDPAAPSGLRPIRSYRRQCKALWNILTQSGLRSNVVGWYASHPAEPINGVAVSDYYRHRPALDATKPWPLAKGAVHPERLAKFLSGLRVHPIEMEAGHLIPFVPQAERIDQQNDERLLRLASTLAECATVHNAATWLMEHEPWDFMAVFYPTLDELGHEFMYYYPPRMEEVPEEDFEIYKDVMPGAYRYHDMMLQRLLQLAGPDTTVILCSDHGFHSGEKRPRDYLSDAKEQNALSELWHRNYGILCAHGPAIKRDERVHGASLLDITPLVLTLFGLPVGQDMDGHVPKIFDKPVEPEMIKSWDEVPGECGRVVESASDADLDRREPTSETGANDNDQSREAEEAIRHLVALGYLDAVFDDKHLTIAKVINESNYHVACSYAESKQFAPAVEILEDLCRQDSKPDFLVALARSYLSLGRYEDSRRTLEQLGSDPSAWPPFGRMVAGLLELTQGNAEPALAHFEAARPGNPLSVELHGHIGRAYSRLGKWTEASEAFRRAIELDPDNAQAYCNLAAVLLSQGKNEEAAEAALESIRLLHHYPDGHYHLGIALMRMGMTQRAIQALEACLTTGPHPPIAASAHELLAKIHAQMKGQEAKAAEHRRLARELATLMSASNAKTTPAVPIEKNEQLTGSPTDPITIVSGLPRCGTSLAMQMLRSGGMPVLTDDVRQADEDNPQGYLEFEAVKRTARDPSWLSAAPGKAVKMIYRLLYDLPPQHHYRVLIMTRQMTEVLASQRAMLTRQQQTGAALDDQQLARVFAQQLDECRAWMSGRPNFDVLEVSYNALVTDPAAEAARINAFLGSRLDAAAMAKCVDPALYRQRNVRPPIEQAV